MHATIPVYGATGAEQDTIELIVALRVRAYSSYRIAKELNLLGIPPRSAPTWRGEAVARIVARSDAHADGDAKAALADLSERPTCPWCGAAADLAWKHGRCFKCGHCVDKPKYACTCKSCERGDT